MDDYVLREGEADPVRIVEERHQWYCAGYRYAVMESVRTACYDGRELMPLHCRANSSNHCKSSDVSLLNLIHFKMDNFWITFFLEIWEKMLIFAPRNTIEPISKQNINAKDDYAMQ